MDVSQRQSLLQHRMAFVSDLEPLDILSHLYQEKVVTENDVERIRSNKTRRERAEMLLDTLPRKGKFSYGKFVDILKVTEGYSHLSTLLSETITKQGDQVDAGASERNRSTEKKLVESENIHGGKASAPFYPMSTIPKGWCLIINNDTFMGSRLPYREGAKVDGENMYKLFQSLYFKVKYLYNIDAVSMKNAVKELSQYDHSGMSCITVALMSHGKQGTIYGIDGDSIDLSTLIQPLLSAQCKSLRGKPKLFFIQACRVNETEVSKGRPDLAGATEHSNTTEITFTPVEGMNDFDRDLNQPQKASSLLNESSQPLEADMVLAYSTFPASVSVRNVYEGSWFIQAIVEVFNEYASGEDVVSMLLRVNDVVASRLSSNGYTQIPAPVITLRKKMYLKDY